MKLNTVLQPTLWVACFTLLGFAAKDQAQPSVTPQPATGISPADGSATLNASVNPNGHLTSAFFEWGPTLSYGNFTATNSVGSGSVAAPASASIVGLASLTNYHFRAVASNSLGVTLGGDLVFSTPHYPAVMTNAFISDTNLEATIAATPHADYGLYASTNLTDWFLVPPGAFTWLATHPVTVRIATDTNAFTKGLWFYKIQ